MHAESHAISFTTNTSGAATAYTSTDVNGRILQIQYVKTDVDNGSTITLTGATTGVPIFAITSMNASATHQPRRAATDAAGAAITYDGTNAVHECVVLAGERVKCVVSSGGSAKSGALAIIAG